MPLDGSLPHLPADQAMRILSLTEKALAARSLEELADVTLPTVVRVMQSEKAFLYVGDRRLLAPCLFLVEDPAVRVTRSRYVLGQASILSEP
jgi:hypothetical protein